MPHCIARLFEQLLGLLLPAHGRHRQAGPVPAANHRPHPAPRIRVPAPLRGEDCALVRPYLLTPHEVRLQRQRRRALWLATHGVDVGPRRIHGVEVAA
ncbi:hypothetical protein J7E91_12130 [Streptomyces sp. ISL-99]|uniref:hypothetical protein n=1 Tax=Streptomyces sp. ISL-99 TaxID=2819193 RepID=UPI001BEB8686|nr:hypothetical protein [Streptomyces sp. ISL-99]MBT2526169.1 hypothetical protein [Streptomyces sp. ISL-99]